MRRGPGVSSRSDHQVRIVFKDPPYLPIEGTDYLTEFLSPQRGTVKGLSSMKLTAWLK